MGFRILDASAFYAGVPFGSSSECYTTSLVYDEIKHIKKRQDVLETLIDTSRLKIKDPNSKFMEIAKSVAKKTGDFQQLTKQDLSVIALCLELGGQIISDDFAILNVAKNLEIDITPVMTQGIRDIGEWIHYCPGCRTNYKNGRECPLCGSSLKRKLVKK